jgi:phosphohistidine phosphatase
MNLYLVQHGDAKPEDLDPDRSLTTAGLGDVVKVATFLEHLRLDTPAIWHSGKKRAFQTAEILVDAFSGARLTARQGLGPDDAIEPVRQEVQAAKGDLMLVGHLPFLSKLASALLAGNPDAGVVTFQKGGVLCLQRGEAGTWSVAWMVVPNLLR